MIRGRLALCSLQKRLTEAGPNGSKFSSAIMIYLFGRQYTEKQEIKKLLALDREVLRFNRGSLLGQGMVYFMRKKREDGIGFGPGERK